MTMSGLDEFGLIQHLTQRLTQKDSTQTGVRVGIGDDAAILKESLGEDWLATTDSMVEGVHFLPTTLSWVDIGYKCVAASISDIAAMGGVPKHVLMSLVISKNLSLTDLEQMYDGVAECCTRYGCQVVGGNVATTTGPAVLTSTVLGTVPAGQALLRSQARPGDVVFVTGSVGGSAAGLAYLTEGGILPADEAMALCHWHQRPTPQVTAGIVLRESGASACNDISDGLASELNEIAKASQVRLRIERARIPLAPEVRNFARSQGIDPLEYAWYGGEDYQLVGTAPSFAFAKALARLQSIGVSLTQIGRVEAGDGVVAEGANQGLEVIEPKGYNHFTSDSPMV